MTLEPTLEPSKQTGQIEHHHFNRLSSTLTVKEEKESGDRDYPQTTLYLVHCHSHFYASLRGRYYLDSPRSRESVNLDYFYATWTKVGGLCKIDYSLPIHFSGDRPCQTIQYIFNLRGGVFPSYSQVISEVLIQNINIYLKKLSL